MGWCWHRALSVQMGLPTRPLFFRLLFTAIFTSVILQICARATPPNILILLVDDLGQRDIGAYNSGSFYETPNIDRLAAEGVLFRDGYAANPVCSPTRYSVMTGKHPTRVTLTNWQRRQGKGFSAAEQRYGDRK